MKLTAPPAMLLSAFRAAEAVGDIGVLLVDDGFDATTMRVLSAWERTEQKWSQPKKPCPDGGRPTIAAWRWLCSTWTVDYAAVADGASVSRDVARERVMVLMHARLIYPDGDVSKAARQAMTATIRGRLKSEQQRSKVKDKDPPAGTPATN